MQATERGTLFKHSYKGSTFLRICLRFKPLGYNTLLCKQYTEIRVGDIAPLNEVFNDRRRKTFPTTFLDTLTFLLTLIVLAKCKKLCKSLQKEELRACSFVFYACFEREKKLP